MSTDRLREILLADSTVLQILEVVRDQAPQGAYVSAGLIRNLIWDRHYGRTPDYARTDVDVVYFDRQDLRTETEARFEGVLTRTMPRHVWQVRNQARMHMNAGDRQYVDIAEALSHWPETATAVAVRQHRGGALEVVAPFGLDDLFGHVLRPTPAILKRDVGIFQRRLQEKGWLSRWPGLKVRLS